MTLVLVMILPVFFTACEKEDASDLTASLLQSKKNEIQATVHEIAQITKRVKAELGNQQVFSESLFYNKVKEHYTGNLEISTHKIDYQLPTELQEMLLTSENIEDYSQKLFVHTNKLEKELQTNHSPQLMIEFESKYFYYQLLKKLVVEEPILMPIGTENLRATKWQKCVASVFGNGLVYAAGGCWAGAKSGIFVGPQGAGAGCLVGATFGFIGGALKGYADKC